MHDLIYPVSSACVLHLIFLFLQLLGAWKRRTNPFFIYRHMRRPGVAPLSCWFVMHSVTFCLPSNPPEQQQQFVLVDLLIYKLGTDPPTESRQVVWRTEHTLTGHRHRASTGLDPLCLHNCCVHNVLFLHCSWATRRHCEIAGGKRR